MAEQEQGNIRHNNNAAVVGMNQDQAPNQITKGALTYALNAMVENFDGNSVSYQNELGNELCVDLPEGYFVIGRHYIVEQNKHVLFITNPSTGDSQIGWMMSGECKYNVAVNSPDLNFDVNYPIHKIVHKITNCSTEIYWTDGYNPRRYMDLDNIPKVLKSGSPLCDPVYTDDLDANQLRIQPNFSIPAIDIKEVVGGGSLIAGVYQFAVQYSDALGNPLTSYYSVTNPVPIDDEFITTPNFNYPVGKSIAIEVNSLDLSGQFQYFNLAVIKTINAITSVELIGTYSIEQATRGLTYTGQNKASIQLSIEEIFERFPYYDVAQDLTTAQDVLIWDQLSTVERVNYQQIATKIHLQWETWRIPPTEDYGDEVNAANFRSYLRDEVEAFEIVFQLANGKETDGFHIPGRTKGVIEFTNADIPDTHPDFVGSPTYYNGDVGYSPYWQIYNTASVVGTSPQYSTAENYKGPYQYGEMAYWESTETYPCNEDLWGELAGQPIRHHKFPDVLVCPIHESRIYSSIDSLTMGNEAIYPLGVKIDPIEIKALIDQSSLTQAQKDDIVGFKIVRGDRSTNKSIVAKGMLRNMGVYTRDDKNYYFPNYPYNDLRTDPFLNSVNNAFTNSCFKYEVAVQSLGPGGYAEIEYTDCNTNKLRKERYDSLTTVEICSIGTPIFIWGTGQATHINYDVYLVKGDPIQIITAEYEDYAQGPSTLIILPFMEDKEIKVVVGTVPTIFCEDEDCSPYLEFVSTNITDDSCGQEQPLKYDEGGYRQIFNSPETSFGQPYLGTILKVENVLFGKGEAHFTEVKKNAKYTLITKEAQEDALRGAVEIADMTNPSDQSALFLAYEASLSIYVNSGSNKNFAYSFNSRASYDYWKNVYNDGNKQRNIELSSYLIPGVTSLANGDDINNFQRESSVYIKTKDSLLYPHLVPEVNSEVIDSSRFTISEKGNCNLPANTEDISVVGYYASLKNYVPNQWGQIYSYQTVDTGYHYNFNTGNSISTIFGGDTFINRFAYKTKLPFFIDHRVGAPDGSDIFYDEIGNVAYPKYWHSARSILANFDVTNGTGGTALLTNIISYKAHNFDCPNDNSNPDSPSRIYYDGYFYLFAYGIPSFYCESSYNVDLRQAFNNREGDFYPHVGTGIPDEWVQESFVSINFDNTYTYNTSFSKQNKELTVTNLPPDWTGERCMTEYPFRAIYSDLENKDADNRVNAWRIYRATSYYDFPRNHGKLISLDGIENSAILARFENKTLLYNNLLTIDTSNPQAAFVGNPTLFKGAPPIDYAETDLGYVGTQHKFLLKIPEGQITVDAKRGQVFLLQGTKVNDISGFGSGMNKFFAEHLPFEILRFFPDVDIDNNFNGIGLHGVHDSDRIIITKLDYVPVDPRIKYDGETHEFYIEEVYPAIHYDCALRGEAYFLDRCRLENDSALFLGITPTTTSTTSTTSTSTSTTTSTSTSTTSTTSTTTTTTTYYSACPEQIVFEYDVDNTGNNAFAHMEIDYVGAGILWGVKPDAAMPTQWQTTDQRTSNYIVYNYDVPSSEISVVYPVEGTHHVHIIFWGCKTLTYVRGSVWLLYLHFLRVTSDVDISIFPALSTFDLIDADVPVLTLPSTVKSGVASEFRIENVQTLQQIIGDIMPYNSTSDNSFTVRNCDDVTLVTVPGGKLYAIEIRDNALLTTLTLEAGTIYAPYHNIYNNPALTTINNFGSTNALKFFNMSGNSSLGYFDIVTLFPNLTDVSGSSLSNAIWNLSNNGYNTATVNQVLVDFDTISVAGYNYRRIDVRTNAAPDNSSGGVDGLAAKASLQSKGFTVLTD